MAGCLCLSNWIHVLVLMISPHSVTVRQTPESKCLRGSSYLLTHAKHVFLSGNVNSWVNSCVFLKDCCSHTICWRNTSILSFKMSFTWITWPTKRTWRNGHNILLYLFKILFYLHFWRHVQQLKKEKHLHPLVNVKQLHYVLLTLSLSKFSCSLVIRAGNSSPAQIFRALTHF